MYRFQYSVTTKASAKLAWKVFSNWRSWNQFANVYGDLRWREGTPWEPGARMEIQLLQPVNVLIDHVITSCTPGERVGWIDHAIGVAMGQWVTFEERAEGTRVHTWGDIVHSGVTIAGRRVEHLITAFTEMWYGNFRAACDRLTEQHPGLAEAGD